MSYKTSEVIMPPKQKKKKKTKCGAPLLGSKKKCANRLREGEELCWIHKTKQALAENKQALAECRQTVSQGVDGSALANRDLRIAQLQDQLALCSSMAGQSDCKAASEAVDKLQQQLDERGVDIGKLNTKVKELEGLLLLAREAKKQAEEDCEDKLRAIASSRMPKDQAEAKAAQVVLDLQNKLKAVEASLATSTNKLTELQKIHAAKVAEIEDVKKVRTDAMKLAKDSQEAIVTMQKKCTKEIADINAAHAKEVSELRDSMGQVRAEVASFEAKARAAVAVQQSEQQRAQQRAAARAIEQQMRQQRQQPPAVRQPEELNEDEEEDDDAEEFEDAKDHEVPLAAVSQVGAQRQQQAQEVRARDEREAQRQHDEAMAQEQEQARQRLMSQQQAAPARQEVKDGDKGTNDGKVTQGAGPINSSEDQQNSAIAHFRRKTQYVTPAEEKKKKNKEDKSQTIGMASVSAAAYAETRKIMEDSIKEGWTQRNIDRMKTNMQKYYKSGDPNMYLGRMFIELWSPRKHDANWDPTDDPNLGILLPFSRSVLDASKAFKEEGIKTWFGENGKFPSRTKYDVWKG